MMYVGGIFLSDIGQICRTSVGLECDPYGAGFKGGAYDVYVHTWVESLSVS